MRFKGYKDGGKVPRRAREQVLERDTSLLVSNTVEELASRPSVPDTLPSKDRIFILDEVLFELNSSKFNERFVFRLDSLVQLLTIHKHLLAAISGHTDNTGSISHNLQLSNERAAAVAAYLVKNNISRDRISFEGVGSKRPIADNKTAEGRRKNRRVEILLSE